MRKQAQSNLAKVTSVIEFVLDPDSRLQIGNTSKHTRDARQNLRWSLVHLSLWAPLKGILILFIREIYYSLQISKEIIFFKGLFPVQFQ